ncbi:myo-inositol-1(or 4)-monophosphatase [Kaistia hirudinis]|uniref:Inositol-1-monophosphatase n=1 Tax=Kaistia hirudinis TaxID=1293440 RepID=A0A840AQW8_9HYPH|nr:inositol monophosphatase family protein [Kaistia hirudinis]MBB3932032.1 myo-inositol-1(or 4)-monophosphatase [Kaistia hirudinis]MBN9016667.1 inositol monophosphatase [Hyphomicrobiales bacterium]
MARSALLNVMVAAVMKAGRTLARDFGEVENLQVSVKGPGDFVSAADKKAEKTLIEELSRARPGYGFLAEESAVIEGTDQSHRWIIDPLDGTTNFLHGIPIFGISVALERDGQIVAGVIFNPVMNELYVAERGGGAFMNDRRMRVATRNSLADSVIATGIPHLGRPGHPAYLKKLERVMLEVAGVRRNGAAALDLAWVASGRFDGYFESDIHPWDMAAGLLLVREAGGFVSDMAGGDRMLETGSICVGNESIHRRLLATLNKA